MLGQGLEKRTLALACPGSFQTPSFTISVVWEIFVAPLIFNFPIWKKKKNEWYSLPHSVDVKTSLIDVKCFNRAWHIQWILADIIHPFIPCKSSLNDFSHSKT